MTHRLSDSPGMKMALRSSKSRQLVRVSVTKSVSVPRSWACSAILSRYDTALGLFYRLNAGGAIQKNPPSDEPWYLHADGAKLN